MDVNNFVNKNKYTGEYTTFKQYTKDIGSFPYQMEVERDEFIVLNGADTPRFKTIDKAIKHEQKGIENVQLSIKRNNAAIKEAEEHIEMLEKLKND